MNKEEISKLVGGHALVIRRGLTGGCFPEFGNGADMLDYANAKFYSESQLIAARKPLEDEIERSKEERDEALRGPWAEWAEKSLKIIREHTGYDGYDDQFDGVDLPNELTEAFGEMEAEADRLRQQLAAAQAQIQQYRTAWEKVRQFDYSGTIWMLDLRSIAESVLALPTNTSALEACIKKAGEVMRERCAEQQIQRLIQRHGYDKYTDAEAIRALPGVTMEDLQK